MTHNEIYTKFMIEYDKANVTSSYPSLTKYEVATILDKAYLALISQKITGNNVRRVSIETDIKSVEDLRPLMKRNTNISLSSTNVPAENVLCGQIPSDCLYFMSAQLKKNSRAVPTKLVNHDIAKSFFVSPTNMPWIKTPVCYLEDDKFYIVTELPLPNTTSTHSEVTFIKKPNAFVKDSNVITSQVLSVSQDASEQIKSIDCFEYTLKGSSEQGYDQDDSAQADQILESMYTFECSDTIAEELISLAIIFALENVESPRLNTKLNTRGLEG